MPEPSRDGDREVDPFEILSASASYLNFLPVIFQNDDFLRRFLGIFETVWEPLEQRQDHIASYFDPHTCPKSFLPWLAGWLNLTFNENWPEWQMRRMIREGFALSRWRGTRLGLEQIIELCVGQKSVITPSPHNQFVFHIEVVLPTDGGVTETFLNQVIQAHKPAHIGYTLEVKPCPQ